MNEKRVTLLEHHGALHQLGKVAEELRELLAEVMNIIEHGSSPKAIKRLKLERCDVANVLPYLDMIFEFDNMDIVCEMDNKLNIALRAIEDGE